MKAYLVVTLIPLLALATLGYSQVPNKDRPAGSIFHQHYDWVNRDDPNDPDNIYGTQSAKACWHVHKSGVVLGDRHGHGAVYSWASTDEDCKVERRAITTPPVTVVTPTNPPITVVTPPAIPITSIVSPDEPAEIKEPDVVPIDVPVVPVRYTMVFPEGTSLLHLPVRPDGISHLTDLFASLGANVNAIGALRPTVQLWSIVTSPQSLHDEWISRHRGILVNMESETTLELTGIARPYGYDFIYLKQGRNLIGVPRQSDALETVGDFYRVFRHVTSVKGLDSDITFSLPIQDDWFVELDRDTVIDGTTGYMIESDTDDVYPVWGTQWTYEPPSAAPGVDQWRYYQNMATTWGALKGGRR